MCLFFFFWLFETAYTLTKLCNPAGDKFEKINQSNKQNKKNFYQTTLTNLRINGCFMHQLTASLLTVPQNTWE